MRISVGDGNIFALRASHRRYTHSWIIRIQYLFMTKTIGRWRTTETSDFTPGELPTHIKINQFSYNDDAEHAIALSID